MKRDKIISALWAVLLGFCLSFSLTSSLVSGFSLAVSVKTLALVCLAGAVIGALCNTLPLGLVPAGVYVFGVGYFWRTGSLEATVESLLYRISYRYHMAYQWPILRWSGRVAEQLDGTLTLGLCLIGLAVAILLTRSICKGKSVFPAVVFNVLCLSVCFVVNDTVPDNLSLFLQFFCLVVLLLTSGVRKRDAGQGNRLTAIAAPVLALCLLILFAAVPRNSYSSDTADKLGDWLYNSRAVQTLLGHSVQMQSTDSNTVDLTQVGYRMAGTNKVLDVKAEFSQLLYLRGKAMDCYDGVSWTQRAEDEDSLSWPQDLDIAGIVEISSKYAHPQLYVPYYVSSPGMRESTYGVTNSRQLTRYSFGVWKIPSPAQMQQYIRMDSSGLSHYMSKHILLPDSVKSWARPLAYSLTGQTGSVYEKAQWIADYVRSSADYNIDTPRMGAREKDFARWFLQDSDTGYCVHFATAATVLLQAADIPARYVTGYVVQTVAGETVEVTADMAHAWCEYWLPGFGWTVLEATPSDTQSDPTEEAVTQPVTPQPMQPTESQPQWTQTQPQRMGRIEITAIVWAVVVLTGLWAVAWGQYVLRRHLTGKALSQGDANAQALARWQYVERLAKHCGQMPSEQLSMLAQKAKFSHHTLTQEELAMFDTEIGGLLVSLKKQNIFRKFYHRFVLALY